MLNDLVSGDKWYRVGSSEAGLQIPGGCLVRANGVPVDGEEWFALSLDDCARVPGAYRERALRCNVHVAVSERRAYVIGDYLFGSAQVLRKCVVSDVQEFFVRPQEDKVWQVLRSGFDKPVAGKRRKAKYAALRGKPELSPVELRELCDRAEAYDALCLRVKALEAELAEAYRAILPDAQGLDDISNDVTSRVFVESLRAKELQSLAALYDVLKYMANSKGVVERNELAEYVSRCTSNRRVQDSSKLRSFERMKKVMRKWGVECWYERDGDNSYVHVADVVNERERIRKLLELQSLYRLPAWRELVYQSALLGLAGVELKVIDKSKE
ncbi:hypothetical protein HY489_01845 [Candidatus Woesearchaeota archaeon]|nr:hypothetical protein [Candidatus Woesearchaeota archaeon]